MERPISYERKNMELVLQVADYFNFEKLDDASPEMVETYEKNNPFISFPWVNCKVNVIEKSAVLFCFGLVWFSLVWFGLVWFGLVWFSLV